MRTPMIAGNWKMHKTLEPACQLVDALQTSQKSSSSQVEVVVAPPFTALDRVSQRLQASHIALAAQNCYPAHEGAYTGEISPLFLKDLGCQYVILGHSERRHTLGEDDAFINQKVHAVLAQGLQPILCVGETLEERESQHMLEIISRQVQEGLKDVDEAGLAQTVIAYEPVWAIGTGRNATPDQAAEAHAYIRGLIQGCYNQQAAAQLRILYGGSVKPDNISDFMAEGDIDGALVGGASLKADDFSQIIQQAGG